MPVSVTSSSVYITANDVIQSVCSHNAASFSVLLWSRLNILRRIFDNWLCSCEFACVLVQENKRAGTGNKRKKL